MVMFSQEDSSFYQNVRYYNIRFKEIESYDRNLHILNIEKMFKLLIF